MKSERLYKGHIKGNHKYKEVFLCGGYLRGLWHFRLRPKGFT